MCVVFKRRSVQLRGNCTYATKSHRFVQQKVLLLFNAYSQQPVRSGKRKWINATHREEIDTCPYTIKYVSMLHVVSTLGKRTR